MNKLDLIKQKVDDLKRRESAVSISEEIIKSLSGIYKTSAKEVKENVATNNLLFFKGLVENVEKKINSQNDLLIESLDKLSAGLTDKSKNAMVAEVKVLVNEIKTLKQKKHFDQEAFNTLFTGTVEKINNIILAANSVASNTSYTRNSQGNISKVTETYENFKLLHSWYYDSDGNLSSVSTVKIDNE